MIFGHPSESLTAERVHLVCFSWCFGPSQVEYATRTFPAMRPLDLVLVEKACLLGWFSVRPRTFQLGAGHVSFSPTSKNMKASLQQNPVCNGTKRLPTHPPPDKRPRTVFLKRRGAIRSSSARTRGGLTLQLSEGDAFRNGWFPEEFGLSSEKHP